MRRRENMWKSLGKMQSAKPLSWVLRRDFAEGILRTRLTCGAAVIHELDVEEDFDEEPE